MACARAVPGATIPVATYAELTASPEGARGSSIALADAYVPVRGAWTVGSAHAGFTAAVRVSPGVTSQCYLVDDISVSRVRDASTD